jgi:hypothetical protein
MPWQNNNYHLTKLRCCKRCSAYYSENKNVGNWRCMYHPSTQGFDINPFHAFGTMACCGKPTGSTGCTPIDHDDEMFAFEDDILLIHNSKSAADKVCTEETKNLILYEDKRPGFETDQKSYVKLWRVNAWIRDQYLKYGEIRQVRFSVKLKGYDAHCVVVNAQERNALNDQFVISTLETYKSKKLNAATPDVEMKWCRRHYGTNWYRITEPAMRHRLKIARNRMHSMKKKFYTTLLDSDRANLENALQDMKKHADVMSTYKTGVKQGRLHEARSTINADLEIAKLAYEEAKRKSDDVVHEIKRQREKDICDALIKAVWESKNEMEDKIIKIGNLEQDVKILYRWNYDSLLWNDISFEALHDNITTYAHAMSPAVAVELSLPDNTVQLKLLPPNGVGITKMCKVDLRNSNENCNAVVEYIFREYPWSAMVDWASVRRTAKVHMEVESLELAAEYKILQQNKV